MRKIVLWGASIRAERFYSIQSFWYGDLIVGVVDKNKSGTFHSLKISDPYEIQNMEFDTLIICSQYVQEIKSEFFYIIPENKKDKIEVIIFDDLIHKLKFDLINFNEKLDGDKANWIHYFDNHDLSVWGPYKKEHTKNVVYYEGTHPYIFIENEKLFYPDDYLFCEEDGIPYVYDILSEQGENSPHLYVRDYRKLIGGCIVDAGACEGNFAIRYAKKADKIYIIESDIKWIEPLKRSFAPYIDKTVICHKRLDRYTSTQTICLDDLVKEKIDFLKMDIEGAEIDALLGGRRVLSESNAECAIAAYHRYKDEENIKYIMSGMGYATSNSKGYMFYMYDKDILYTLDIRRGIVYCDKK